MSVLASRRADAKPGRLASLPLFANCSPADLAKLAEAGDETEVEAGTILVREERGNDWFFVILNGEATVSRNGSVLGSLGPGDHFGEMTLIGERAHTTTVTARRDLVVLVLGRRQFIPLVDDLACFSSFAATARQLRFERATRVALKRVPTRWQRRRRVAAALLGSVLLALTLGTLYHPPIAVVSPGPAIDITDDIAIDGAPVTRLRGRYLVTAVHAERPTLVGLLWSMAHGAETLSASHVISGRSGARAATSDTRYPDSLQAAVVAAARASGLRVTREADGRWAVPFRVTVRERQLWGGSAGLVYALAIADALDTRDLAAGRVIAATGTITEEGEIGGVSRLIAKARAAFAAGADVFFVPADQSLEVSSSKARGVRSLKDAIEQLAMSAKAERGGRVRR